MCLGTLSLTVRCNCLLGVIAMAVVLDPVLPIVAISASQPLNMFDVGCSANRQTGRLQTSHTELNAIDGHDFHRLAFDVGQKSRQGKYPIWGSGLKFCISGEHNNRANGISRQEFQEFVNCPRMVVVLASGVLK